MRVTYEVGDFVKYIDSELGIMSNLKPIYAQILKIEENEAKSQYTVKLLGDEQEITCIERNFLPIRIIELGTC